MSISIRVWGTVVLMPLIVGCGDGSAGDLGAQTSQVAGEGEAIENGNDPLPSSRPYEANFAQMWNKTKGVKCTATLMGPTRTSATWALTAAHCIKTASDSVSIIPQSGPHVYATQIVFAPDSPSGHVDAVMLQLSAPVPVSAGVYFTTADGNGLDGQTKRCYGYGGTTFISGETYSGQGLHWADFQMLATADPMRINVNEPNAQGQSISPGDSGGPCFNIGSDASTALTITSISKAGAWGSMPTYADETAAVAFSSWVRGFVPRPN